MRHLYLVFTVVLGCSGDVGGRDNTSQKPDASESPDPQNDAQVDAGQTLVSLPLGEFAATWADIACTKLQECCTNAELDYYLWLGTHEQCVESFRFNVGDPRLESFQSSIDMGRAVYDPIRANDCMKKLEGLSCSMLGSDTDNIFELQACIYPMLAKSSEACKYDYECISGWCDIDICKTPSVGSPCASVTCGSSLHCADATCAVEKGVGQGCENPHECTVGFCPTFSTEDWTADTCTAICDGL